MGTLSWPRAMSLWTKEKTSVRDLRVQTAETPVRKNNSFYIMIIFNLCRIFSSTKSRLLLLPRSFLLACRTAQAFELWLQQSGAVSPSRFFKKTLAPRFKKSLRRHFFSGLKLTWTRGTMFLKIYITRIFVKELTHVTQSKRFSRAAMCRGESPWMLTACISQLASRSSTAISTQPEKAAQWRQIFSS